MVGNIDGDGDCDDDTECLERKNRESCEHAFIKGQCGVQKRSSGTVTTALIVHQSHSRLRSIKSGLDSGRTP